MVFPLRAAREKVKVLIDTQIEILLDSHEKYINICQIDRNFRFEASKLQFFESTLNRKRQG